MIGHGVRTPITLNIGSRASLIQYRGWSGNDVYRHICIALISDLYAPIPLVSRSPR